jgi:hypothetical protein
LMRAFAKQSLNGLWLTSFSIDSRSEQLNISGRTLQSELVPEFIARLSNEPALKGKLFSALNMSLPKVTGMVNATTNISAPVAASANTSGIKNGVSSLSVNSTTANVQNMTPSYIEFSLQSTDDKSVAMNVDTKAGGKL